MWIGHPVLLGVEDEEVVLWGSNGDHFSAHVQDNEDGESRAVGGGVLGGLPDVLSGGRGCNRLVARDFEFGGDPVMSRVEVAMCEWSPAFDPALESGVVDEGNVEIVVELAFVDVLAAAILLVPGHGEPDAGDGVEKSGERSELVVRITSGGELLVDAE